MADAALFRRRRHDAHIADFSKFLFERGKPRRVDSIVIGQQDLHITVRNPLVQAIFVDEISDRTISRPQRLVARKLIAAPGPV